MYVNITNEERNLIFNLADIHIQRFNLTIVVSDINASISSSKCPFILNLDCLSVNILLTFSYKFWTATVNLVVPSSLVLFSIYRLY